MIRTIKHLCCALHVSEDSLKNILTNIDTFYGEKRQEKYLKNGKLKLNKEGTPRYRIINPSYQELKIIQKKLNAYLTNNITPAEYAYGATKGRDNVTNAEFHKGNKYFFQTDLQDFFPFITSEATYNMFLRHGFSPDIASRLTKLTTYTGHLPQGAATSATIANLVFAETGDKLAAYCKEHELRFSTFVDDVTISAPFDFKEKIPELLAIITAGGFKISHTKTTYKTDHPIVTGVKISQNSLNVTDKFKAKIKATEGKSEAQIQGEANYRNKVHKSNAHLPKQK